MEYTRERSWWVYLLQGLLTVAFGVVAIGWPGITLYSFILLFGAYAVVHGVVRLLEAFRIRADSSWWDVLTSILAGIGSIAAGIVAFAWPALTGLLLLFVIGAYALFAGVMVIVATMASLRSARGRVMELLLALVRGVVAIIFGVLAFTLPGVTALSLAWLIGIYAIVVGVSEAGFSFVAWREQCRG